MGFRADMWEYALGPLPAPQWLPFDPQSPPVVPVGTQLNLLVRWEGQVPGGAAHYATAEVTGPDGRAFSPTFVLGGPGESAHIFLGQGQVTGEAFSFVPELPGTYQARVVLYGE
jgi:hypothetical protein